MALARRFAMSNTKLQVAHVYAHDQSEFEKELNGALARIVESKGVIGDIKYAIDPSSKATGARGGFGALVIYEREGPG